MSPSVALASDGVVAGAEDAESGGDYPAISITQLCTPFSKARERFTQGSQAATTAAKAARTAAAAAFCENLRAFICL